MTDLENQIAYGQKFIRENGEDILPPGSWEGNVLIEFEGHQYTPYWFAVAVIQFYPWYMMELDEREHFKKVLKDLVESQFSTAA